MGTRLFEPSFEQVNPKPAVGVPRESTPIHPSRSVRDTVARIQHREFMELARAYAAPDGMASGDEVAGRMRRHCDQPISALARLIVQRRIVSLLWHGQILIPLFQFNASDMSLHPSVSEVIAELESDFNDWEVAQWFAQANAWLRDRRPMDVVAIDGPAVVQAARADRSVARG
jgi:hypothetical protein